jgi:N-acetylmuramoyl-L-alanine amidase
MYVAKATFRFALGLFLCLAGAMAAIAAPQGVGAKVTQRGTETRIVAEFTQKLTAEIFLLADPYRVVVDLPEVDWLIDAAAGAQGAGGVGGFRFGAFRPGAARMVLDLKQPMTVAESHWLAPDATNVHWRFAVSLKPADRTQFLAAMRRPVTPAAAPTAPAIAPRPAPRPAVEKPLIVVDPGHGGIDPGAIGAQGTYEKDVTLTWAKEFKAGLQRSGRFRVMLTRERDVFLPLAERVRVARAAGASLFISVHADSIHDNSVHGATVYTLSEVASDRAAEQLAAKENRSDVLAGVDLASETEEVSAILIDLAWRETMNHSARFAQTLLGELGEQLKQPRQAHRFAGFKVLKAPDVPSVLFEIGYLTNRQDEAMLITPKGRKKTIGAAITAVEDYFSRPRAELR